MAKDEFTLEDFKKVVETEKLLNDLNNFEGETPEYLKIFMEYLKIVVNPEKYYEDEFNKWLIENPKYNELLVNAMKGSYNGFKGKTRDKGQKLINNAIEADILLPLNKTKCCICGQEKGIREYHCEDYSPENVVDNAVPICKHCHMYLHKHKHQDPESWEQYKKDVKEKRKDPWYDKSKWTEEDDGEIDLSRSRKCPKL